MDKLQLLERYYNSFINVENPRDFFIGLADYLEYADSVPEFDQITTNLFNQRKPFEDEYLKCEKIASEKIKEIGKEIIDYIKEKDIHNERIDGLLDDYQKWLDGGIVGSRALPNSLHQLLLDIIRILIIIPEHQDFVSQFVSTSPHDKSNNKFFLPDELRMFIDAESSLKTAKEEELWGRASKLSLLYQIIKSGKKQHEILVEELEKKRCAKNSWNLVNYGLILSEWEMIQSGNLNHRPLVFFNIKECKSIITRLHNYTISKYLIHDSKTNIIVEQEVPLAEKNECHVLKSNAELSSDGKYGFIQRHKRGEKIKIGGLTTRKFRLIKCLFSPENSLVAENNAVFQQQERVFNNVRLDKDYNNQRLQDAATKNNEIHAIIVYTIKEIQKDKELRFLKFEWRKFNTELRMQIGVIEG